MKIIKKYCQIVLLVLLLSYIQVLTHGLVGEATNTFSLTPFQKKDYIIPGVIKPSSTANLQVNHRLIEIKSDASGKFSYKLNEQIGDQEVVLFVKDSKGFEQNRIRQYASDSEKSSSGVIAPTYLGIQNNHFILRTENQNTIFASYEDKKYSGSGILRIPKSQSNEIKFFSQSNSGLNSKVIVRQASQVAEIQLSPFDFSGSTLSGVAWPFTTIQLLDEQGILRASADTDAEGIFQLKIQLSEYELKKETLWTVQETSGDPSFNQKTFRISAFNANESVPSYFSYDMFKNEIIIKTYSDAEVRLDKNKCPSVQDTSIIRCDVSMTNDSKHVLDIYRAGKLIRSEIIETVFKNDEFPWNMHKTLASTNARLNGETFEKREFRLIDGNGLSINFLSDEEGHFDVTLPMTYRAGYQLYIKGTDDRYQFIKYVQVLDDRKIPKPTFRTREKEWFIFNSLRDVELKGELWIERTDGTFTTKSLEFKGKDGTVSSSHTIVKGMQDGDRYTLRLFREINDPYPRIVKGIFKALKRPVIDYTQSDALTLVGETTPNAKVSLSIPIFSLSDLHTGLSHIQVRADENGVFRATLKNKHIERIDYTGETLEAFLTSQDKNDQDYFGIQLKDTTPPNVDLNSPILPDYDTRLYLTTDDRLTKLEIQYYKKDKLATQKTITPVKSLNIPFDKKGRISYQDAEITAIKVQVTNRNQQTSGWKTFKVQNSEFAKVQHKKIYVGDGLIRGKSSTRETIQWVVNEITYVVTPATDGSFQVKLNSPIKKGTRKIKYIMKNEIGDTQKIYVEVYKK